MTRQQFAALLYRFAVMMGYDVSVGESTNILSYADAFDAAEYAIPALQWACGAGDHPRHRRRLHPQPPGHRHPGPGGGDAGAVL